MRQDAVRAELARRAADQLASDHLVVDYYRVRRRLAYPLPVRAFRIHEYPLRRDQEDHRLGYPWSIWLSWALEERVYALGWHAEFAGDADCTRAACRDLAALAQWPRWRQYDWPDLCAGHVGRLMATALGWRLLDADTRGLLQAACARLSEDSRQRAQMRPGPLHDSAAVLAHEQPHHLLHNIPWIGCLGGALAAHAIDHPAAAELDDLLEVLLEASFALRERDGFTEGVGYDGYLWDFIAPWLAQLGQDRRDRLLADPHAEDCFQASLHLTAPGDCMAVAEIGDVEAVQMPFHAGAQAKQQALNPLPERQWYLARCRLDALRSDALAALHALDEIPEREPVSGAMTTASAVVLRSGWRDDDAAVAIAANTSVMGHLHHDTGSLLIGTGGAWLLTDPGYQQYMPTAERTFSFGTRAHNAPLIDGRPQDHKAVRIVDTHSDEGTGAAHVRLDLRACYGEGLQLRRAERAVWLCRDGLIVVADAVVAPAAEQLSYHWHGHPDAAWWVADGWARIHLGNRRLWLGSPQATIGEHHIDRLRGSRGQLTCCIELPVRAVTWWLFSLDARPEAVLEGDALRIDHRLFRL